MEHPHKFKARKVIVTSSKVSGRGPERCLNINKMWCILSLLSVWRWLWRGRLSYWLDHDFKPPATQYNEEDRQESQLLFLYQFTSHFIITMGLENLRNRFRHFNWSSLDQLIIYVWDGLDNVTDMILNYSFLHCLWPAGVNIEGGNKHLKIPKIKFLEWFLVSRCVRQSVVDSW